MLTGLASLVLLVSGPAAAAVHKCKNAQGRVVYQQHPCADSATQSVVNVSGANVGKRNKRAGKRSYKRKKYANRSRASAARSGSSSNSKSSQRSRKKTKSARAERKRQKMLKRLRCERAQKSLAKRTKQNGVEYINMLTGQRMIKNDADARRLIRETKDKVRRNC